MWVFALDWKRERSEKWNLQYYHHVSVRGDNSSAPSLLCFCWQVWAKTTMLWCASGGAAHARKICRTETHWSRVSLLSFSLFVSLILTRYILYFHVCSESQWGCISKPPNLRSFIDFLPAHPGDLIANNRVTSPSYQMMHERPFISSFWEAALTPQPSVSVITLDEILSLVICCNLCSSFACFTVPVFVACFHSGRALQMQDDPAISGLATDPDSDLSRFSLRKSVIFHITVCYFKMFSYISFCTVFEVLVDIYSLTPTAHWRKQWNLLPWLTH